MTNEAIEKLIESICKRFERDLNNFDLYCDIPNIAIALAGLIIASAIADRISREFNQNS